MLLLLRFLVLRVTFFITLAFSFFISNTLLGMDAVNRYQKGQESTLNRDLFRNFGEWKSFRGYIGSIFQVEPMEVAFQYNDIPIFIKAYRNRMEVYKNSTGDGTPTMKISPTDAICSMNQSQFYSELRKNFAELPELPVEPEPEVVAPPNPIPSDPEAERIRKEQVATARLKAESDNRKFWNQVYLSLGELGTSVGGSVFTTISEYFKGKDENSRKAVFTEIVANLFLISNYILSGLNQLEDGKQAYLDYSTVISILVRVTVTTMLIKKLFEPRKKKSENSINVKTEKDRHTEDKNNKTIDIKKLGKIAAYLGGILPCIRSYKFGPGGKHTYIITLLIQLAYAMEIASKTNSSDSKLFKTVVPLVIGGLPIMAAVGDQFTSQAIWKK